MAMINAVQCFLDQQFPKNRIYDLQPSEGALKMNNPKCSFDSHIIPLFSLLCFLFTYTRIYTATNLLSRMFGVWTMLASVLRMAFVYSPQNGRSTIQFAGYALSHDYFIYPPYTVFSQLHWLHSYLLFYTFRSKYLSTTLQAFRLPPSHHSLSQVYYILTLTPAVCNLQFLSQGLMNQMRRYNCMRREGYIYTETTQSVYYNMCRVRSQRSPSSSCQIFSCTNLAGRKTI